jgi:chaperonin GroES
MKKQKAKIAKKPVRKEESSQKNQHKQVVVEAQGEAQVGSSSSSESLSKITPLGDRVLIKPSTAAEIEKKNDFGIIIPETISKERPEQGRVVAVGEGRYENGKLVPVKVKVGDMVVFSKYGFDEVKDGADELYILKEDSILAIIRN